MFLGMLNICVVSSRVYVCIFSVSQQTDLQALAKQLNPMVGYWDPLGISDSAYWGQNDEFTIGWLRQSEIKHGRVAMAAFVGK